MQEINCMRVVPRFLTFGPVPVARDGRGAELCGKGARTLLRVGARSVRRPCSSNVGGNKEFDLVHLSGVPSFTTIYILPLLCGKK